jgi:antitoxin Xre/MbcA/ParS-like protein
MSTRHSLFNTVSHQDSLKFWRGNRLDYQRVRDFVGFDTRDVSRMAGVAKSSVRYDDKAPKEVREHLESVANICNLVYQFFGNEVKTKLWLQTPNPLLGDVSPRDMLRLGRYNKLLRFVTQAMEEGGGRGEASQTSTASLQDL